MTDSYKFEIKNVCVNFCKDGFYYNISITNYCSIENVKFSFETIIYLENYEGKFSVEKISFDDQNTDFLSGIFHIASTTTYDKDSKKCYYNERFLLAKNALLDRLNNKESDIIVKSKTFTEFSEALTNWYKSTLEPIAHQQKQIQELCFPAQGENNIKENQIILDEDSQYELRSLAYGWGVEDKVSNENYNCYIRDALRNSEKILEIDSWCLDEDESVEKEEK